MEKACILIVDDEADIRDQVAGLLQDEGYDTCEAATSIEALEVFSDKKPDLVILDVWLNDKEFDGLVVLRKMKARHSQIPVIMMSGHETIVNAVEALELKAFDFLVKPFQTDKLLQNVKNALAQARLEKENQELRVFFPKETKLQGRSNKIQNIAQTISKVASTNSRVLITGPGGSGKEVAARMIHDLSPRAGKPFMVLHCASLHPARFEQELFGNDATGPATTSSVGVLEQGEGGTLLLDEIADMPLETQGKMVRVLQEQTFYRLGSRQPRPMNMRILASSNRDLEKLMEDGVLRQDLYYRLNVVPLVMPALVDIPEDIPVLVQYFMEKSCRDAGIAPKRFTEDVMSAFKSHNWPGNVRQLRNAVEWIIIMHAGESNQENDKSEDGNSMVTMAHLPPDLSVMAGQDSSYKISADFLALSLKEAREIFEKDYLSAQLRRFGGNISRTSECIGMERSALHRKLRTLGLHTSERPGNTVNAIDRKQNAKNIAVSASNFDKALKSLQNKPISDQGIKPSVKKTG